MQILVLRFLRGSSLVEQRRSGRAILNIMICGNERRMFTNNRIWYSEDGDCPNSPIEIPGRSVCEMVDDMHEIPRCS
jgi:hypothetical protein